MFSPLYLSYVLCTATRISLSYLSLIYRFKSVPAQLILVKVKVNKLSFALGLAVTPAFLGISTLVHRKLCTTTHTYPSVHAGYCPLSFPTTPTPCHMIYSHFCSTTLHIPCTFPRLCEKTHGPSHSPQPKIYWT